MTNDADAVTGCPLAGRRLAGHSRVETTATYDRRGEDAKHQGVDHISFPLVACAQGRLFEREGTGK